MVRAEKVPFPELHVRPKWVKICLSKDVQQADRQCREEMGKRRGMGGVGWEEDEEDELIEDDDTEEEE